MDGHLKGPAPPRNEIIRRERVQQLMELGFDWMGLGPKQYNKHKTFSEWFEDLRQYKAKYGDCNVSTPCEFKSLAEWCWIVRTSKKKMDGHLKGPAPRMKLSEERECSS